MTDKVKKSEQKLIRAFGNVTDMIVENARKMKNDEGDTKKLKELTTIAKELYAIVKDTSDGEIAGEEGIDVLFVGEGETWAE